MAKIDHAAIRTASYENAQKFFEDVFEMHMWRESGEKPGRKCWYEEGIQLCEMEEINTEGENGYDHISIAVDSVEETMGKDQGLSGKSNQRPLVLIAEWNENRIKTSGKLEGK